MTLLIAEFESNIYHISVKWVHELRLYQPFTPLILVGTQMDLVSDPITQTRLTKRNQTPVSSVKAHMTASAIDARKYIECSAATGVQYSKYHDPSICYGLICEVFTCY